MPGIGLIKRRLETEEQAVALATSHILKEYDVQRSGMPEPGSGGGGEEKEGIGAGITTLETKYDNDSGDWYVALGWNSSSRAAVVRMDSILGTVTDTREIRRT